MRVVAVVTLQAKPWTCCGAFTLFQMYNSGKSAGLTPAAVSMLGLGLSVFKGLRQADQHSAHERGIILRERMHDLQSSLPRRTHGSLRFPCVRTERLLHVRACVGSPARDVVENGFPLLFGAVARLLGGLLDAVEELFFKRLELLESLFHARFLEARATFGQFLQRDLVGFDDLEQGIIHPRELTLALETARSMWKKPCLKQINSVVRKVTEGAGKVLVSSIWSCRPVHASLNCRCAYG